MKAGVAHPAIYTHPLVGQFPHSDPTRGYPGSGSAIVRPPIGSGKDTKPYAVGTPVHFMAKAGNDGQHVIINYYMILPSQDSHRPELASMTCASSARAEASAIASIAKGKGRSHVQYAEDMGTCASIPN